LLGPINKNLERWGSLPHLLLSFAFLRLESELKDLNLSFQLDEGERAVTSVVVCKSCSDLWSKFFYFRGCSSTRFPWPFFEI
jgi:hypothetical protein